MNTTPDEVMLALWLDDELTGEDLARVESWALTQPDQLAARDEVRAWRKSVADAVPAEVEPPYPDFFNSRIEKAIREIRSQDSLPAPAGQKASLWRWMFPATAFAGMVLAFWVGTKANSPTASPVVKIEDKGIIPVWYTPEQGVDAEWVKGKGASSNVIVLQGLNAIPDSLDFTETASFQNHAAGSESTAGTSEPKPAQ